MNEIKMPEPGWADPGREIGFHDGIEFAVAVIENALVKNPDIPFIAFGICKKTLLKKEPVSDSKIHEHGDAL